MSKQMTGPIQSKETPTPEQLLHQQPHQTLAWCLVSVTHFHQHRGIAYRLLDDAAHLIIRKHPGTTARTGATLDRDVCLASWKWKPEAPTPDCDGMDLLPVEDWVPGSEPRSIKPLVCSACKSDDFPTLGQLVYHYRTSHGSSDELEARDPNQDKVDDDYWDLEKRRKWPAHGMGVIRVFRSTTSHFKAHEIVTINLKVRFDLERQRCYSEIMAIINSAKPFHSYTASLSSPSSPSPSSSSGIDNKSFYQPKATTVNDDIICKMALLLESASFSHGKEFQGKGVSGEPSTFQLTVNVIATMDFHLPLRQSCGRGWHLTTRSLDNFQQRLASTYPGPGYDCDLQPRDVQLIWAARHRGDVG
ncbi:hypothetical protein CDD80_4562 [Ophiocordyceps camponoti-rufipedis]|uniref:Uncharacterized protein n=1 Tax=Ophiocordyceps camponoti-rufipedis TaxID=2004952 RepID=A0A2C5YZQ5_9HYPO|nr:hypothetical protein CDD80_4562 [Ophiocordyceps camponoti-rufipedis]